MIKLFRKIRQNLLARGKIENLARTLKGGFSNYLFSNTCVGALQGRGERGQNN